MNSSHTNEMQIRRFVVSEKNFLAVSVSNKLLNQCNVYQNVKFNKQEINEHNIFLDKCQD